MAGKFDPPYESRSGQHAETVVGRLHGQGPEHDSRTLRDFGNRTCSERAAASSRTESTASRGRVTRRPR
jgi:hypothetical protein